jgi:hypothetical protein
MSTAFAGAARLDAAMAGRLAARALANIAQCYPWQPAHVQLAPEDHAEPQALHPAFWGSYDWHSCVHMQWLLARVRRLHPRIAQAPDIAGVLETRLTAANVAAEVGYFARPGTQSFERTYGWAWLLALADELEGGAAHGVRAAQALAPLTRVIEQRYEDYLPRARYPIRHGVHPNSAFGLAFALDHARASGNPALAARVASKAIEWFGADRDLPVAFEPSGADFLSPALMECELMRRVLPAGAFGAWLAAAFPGCGDVAALHPVEVSDRSDPQIVHLDGLNLSRAWCLRGIAAALPAGDGRVAPLRGSAERHLRAGLAGLASEDYAGAHWLGSFALLALTA